MTLTLDMAPEMETQIREAAARGGLEPERYVLEAVEESLARAAEEQRQAEALEWAEGMRSCSD